MLRWNLESSYLALPESLYAFVRPDAVPAPAWSAFNAELARDLGMGETPAERDLAILSGKELPEGARPYAQAYAGHQFGHFAILGDGRAAVLGELLDPRGQRWDLQLKGSGPTPYARNGDGKAALGPMLREYLIGEYFHALGLPTTRALAVVASGERIWRGEPKPGAVLCRVAASHLRVGTFQYAAARLGKPELRALADYAIARHYPRLAAAEQPYAAFLDAVGEAQATLVARWMCLGFVHGVMNTDNVALSGQAIDFGPCAFLDAFRFDQVFSSIDQEGRYAWGKQSHLACWNHARFAEALLPLLDRDENRALERARASVESFQARISQALIQGFAQKLGMAQAEEGDAELVQRCLVWMEAAGADFTTSFVALTQEIAGGGAAPLPERAEWHGDWLARLKRESDPGATMRAANPRVHPRNRPVQDALDTAEAGDLAPFREVLACLQAPWSPDAALPRLAAPSAEPQAFVTYCGT